VPIGWDIAETQTIKYNDITVWLHRRYQGTMEPWPVVWYEPDEDIRVSALDVTRCLAAAGTRKNESNFSVNISPANACLSFHQIALATKELLIVCLGVRPIDCPANLSVLIAAELSKGSPNLPVKWAKFLTSPYPEMVVANGEIFLKLTSQLVNVISALTGEPTREPVPIPLLGEEELDTLYFSETYKPQRPFDVTAAIRWAPLTVSHSSDFLLMDLLNYQISRFPVVTDESNHF
jgi:hypothetical protein